MANFNQRVLEFSANYYAGQSKLLELENELASFKQLALSINFRRWVCQLDVDITPEQLTIISACDKVDIGNVFIDHVDVEKLAINNYKGCAYSQFVFSIDTGEHVVSVDLTFYSTAHEDKNLVENLASDDVVAHLKIMPKAGVDDPYDSKYTPIWNYEFRIADHEQAFECFQANRKMLCLKYGGASIYDGHKKREDFNLSPLELFARKEPLDVFQAILFDDLELTSKHYRDLGEGLKSVEYKLTSSIINFNSTFVTAPISVNAFAQIERLYSIVGIAFEPQNIIKSLSTVDNFDQFVYPYLPDAIKDKIDWCELKNNLNHSTIQSERLKAKAKVNLSAAPECYISSRSI